MGATSRMVVVVAAAALAGGLAAPTALAGESGKSGGTGCSNPYTSGHYDPATGLLYFDDTGLAEPRTEELVDSGAFTLDEMDALLESIDHNGDQHLCFKTPSGWTSGNTANRDGFVNLVDNKA